MRACVRGADILRNIIPHHRWRTFCEAALSCQGASAYAQRWRALQSVQRTADADRQDQYLSARPGSPSHAVERCSRREPTEQQGPNVDDLGQGSSEQMYARYVTRAAL